MCIVYITQKYHTHKTHFRLHIKMLKVSLKLQIGLVKITKQLFKKFPYSTDLKYFSLKYYLKVVTLLYFFLLCSIFLDSSSFLDHFN